METSIGEPFEQISFFIIIPKTLLPDDFSRERFGIKIVIVGNRRDFFSNLGVTFEDYAVVYSKELG